VVEALCYKPEDRGFDSRWSHYIFLFYLIISSRVMSLGVNSASTRNECQESDWDVNGGRRVRLTTSPPSVGRLSRENMGASTFHNPMGLHGLLQGYLYLTNIYRSEVLRRVKMDTSAI
jgi:hypothetical protein